MDFKEVVSFLLSVLPVNLLKCVKRWITVLSSSLLLGPTNSCTFCILSMFIIEERFRIKKLFRDY